MHSVFNCYAIDLISSNYHQNLAGTRFCTTNLIAQSLSSVNAHGGAVALELCFVTHFYPYK